jgi:hypothetical protein
MLAYIISLRAPGPKAVLTSAASRDLPLLGVDRPLTVLHRDGPAGEATLLADLGAMPRCLFDSFRGRTYHCAGSFAEQCFAARDIGYGATRKRG